MNTAYIIAGYRSAVGKSGKGFFKFTRPDNLAADVVKHLVASVPGLDKEKIDFMCAQSALVALKKIDTVLGVMGEDENNQSDEIVELIKRRNMARDNKEWAVADGIRKELDAMGIVLEDTSEGTIWKKK